MNVLVATKIIKCPKFDDLNCANVRDKLAEYRRYLQQHAIEPATTKAAQLQNNCSESVLRTLRRLELKPEDYEYEHDELEVHLERIAKSAAGDQSNYVKWALSNKVRLKFIGSDESHVETQFRDLTFELQEKERETQRNALNLNSKKGRIELSKLYAFLLPPKYRTRYTKALQKIPDAKGELTQYENPEMEHVKDTFLKVLHHMNMDLAEMNYEPQQVIDPRKPLRKDERPAAAKKKNGGTKRDKAGKDKASPSQPKDSHKAKSSGAKCSICKRDNHTEEECWFKDGKVGKKRNRSFQKNKKNKKRRFKFGAISAVKDMLEEQSKELAELREFVAKVAKSLPSSSSNDSKKKG